MVFSTLTKPFMVLEVSFATYISPSFDLSLQGNYGNYGYFPTSNTLTNMLGAKYEGTLSLH